MFSTATPLQLLTDALATPREVERVLRKKMDGILIEKLRCGIAEKKAKNLLRNRAEDFLDTRGFANFGRKRTLDKLVNKAMKRQSEKCHRRRLILEDEKRKYERTHGSPPDGWYISTMRIRISESLWE